MKIMVVHNRYRQPGGEDAVFSEEIALLRAYGHTVLENVVTNQDIDDSHLSGKLNAMLNAVWNPDTYRRFRTFFRSERPDTLHVHNFFPLVSPALYHAAASEGVPVVQTLHNYRLLCPNAIFYRDGAPCEDCLGQPFAWSGVLHGCYRDSRAASAGVATMAGFHRMIGTWSEKVSAYVALTEFARQKFIAGGFPAEKIFVKPNFVCPDPGYSDEREDYFLFVGRLTQEKGILTLLDAWRRLGGTIPLKVVGEGPLQSEVRRQIATLPGVEYIGFRPLMEVHQLLTRARALVFPSQWYETFGRVLVEAFAAGRPVLAANLGAAGEIVEHARTGLHFVPGDPADLAAKVLWAWDNPRELEMMGMRARVEYEAKYTATRNYANLMEIYSSARERSRVKV